MATVLATTKMEEKMNKRYYAQILEEFKSYHPYLAENIRDWSPRGEHGIRVAMVDGTEYDFHVMSKTVRNVQDRPVHHDDQYDETEWREIFADRLAESMATKGMDQRSLAEYTGLSQGAISGYINKKSTPSGYALTMLARALDCTIMDLTI